MPQGRRVEDDADRVKRLARQSDKLIREQTLSNQTDADLLRVLMERAALIDPYFEVVSTLLMEIYCDAERVHRRVRDRANTVLGHLDDLAGKAEDEGLNRA